MIEWFYDINNEEKGPVTEVQIGVLLGQLIVNGDTLVWSSGMNEWKSLRETELEHLLRPKQVESPPDFAAPLITQEAMAPKSVGFIEAIARGYSKYASVSGRASRSEYWFFMLFFYVVYFFVLVGYELFDHESILFLMGALVWGAFTLGAALPMVAVAIRRLHDIDRAGWWLLIGFIPIVGQITLLIFFCLKGDSGPNRFGQAAAVLSNG